MPEAGGTPDPEPWIGTPAAVAAAAADVLGPERFAAWCADVLTAETSIDDLVAQDDPDPRWLAGRSWTTWGPPQTWTERGIDYWPRVWAARSLLHQWHPVAEPAIVIGLADDHWRVREMCAKVAARHELGGCAEACGRLALEDDNSRVRIAALRAIGRVGEYEQAAAIEAAAQSADPAIIDAATRAREQLADRLDRPLHPD